MTTAEIYDLALARVAARIAEYAASWKPTHSVDGESYQHTEHYRALIQEQANLKKLRQEADNGGAWEIRSRGTT